MTRLRMPAYGKALYERRQAGDHPLGCELVFAQFWPPAGTSTLPRLALKPAEYRPGTYDFRVVIGMHVRIQCGRDFRIRPLLQLAGELGAWASFVEIAGYWERPVTAQLLSFRAGRESGRRAWPRWWPRETEQVNNGRIKLWLEAAEGRLGQESEERRAA